MTIADLKARLTELASGAHKARSSQKAATTLEQTIKDDLAGHVRTGHALEVASVDGSETKLSISLAGYTKYIPGLADYGDGVPAEHLATANAARAADVAKMLAGDA